MKLRQGKELFADREFMIFLFLDKGEKPDGKSFEVRPKRSFGVQVPHVHVGWKVPKETLPKTQAFVDGYTMRLQFGPSRNGQVPGQIYLCLPDKEKSFLAGTFTAAIK